MIDRRRLFQLELRQIARSRVAVATVIVVVVAGIAAAMLGAHAVQTREQALAALEPELAEHVAQLRAVHPADGELGLPLYYLTLPSARVPNAWAGLSTGLDDVHPASQPIRMLGLVPQLHEPEVPDALRAAHGGIDLAFVIVFLLPLLVIALGHDLWSAEDDAGAGPLVRALPACPSSLLAVRVAARGLVVGAVALALVGIGFVAVVAVGGTLGGALDGRAVAWAATTVIYAGVWQLAVLVVATLRRTSNWNAVVLVSIWLTTTTILPGIVNLAIAAAAPLPDGVALTLTQRQEMNSGWDRPKEATMAPFRAAHPQYAGVTVPPDRFSWPWYYAMHDRGDAAVAPALARYREALAERSNAAWLSGLVLPTVAAQRTFVRIAGTDLATMLAYRDSIAAYHAELKHLLYPRVVADERWGDLSIDSVPRHRFTAAAAPGIGAMLPLVGFAIVLALIARVRARALDRAALTRADRA